MTNMRGIFVVAYILTYRLLGIENRKLQAVESPPRNAADALARWADARRRFQTAYARAEQLAIGLELLTALRVRAQRLRILVTVHGVAGRAGAEVAMGCRGKRSNPVAS